MHAETTRYERKQGRGDLLLQRVGEEHNPNAKRGTWVSITTAGLAEWRLQDVCDDEPRLRPGLRRCLDLLHTCEAPGISLIFRA